MPKYNIQQRTQVFLKIREKLSSFGIKLFRFGSTIDEGSLFRSTNHLYELFLEHEPTALFAYPASFIGRQIESWLVNLEGRSKYSFGAPFLEKKRTLSELIEKNNAFTFLHLAFYLFYQKEGLEETIALEEIEPKALGLDRDISPYLLELKALDAFKTTVKQHQKIHTLKAVKKLDFSKLFQNAAIVKQVHDIFHQHLISRQAHLWGDSKTNTVRFGEVITVISEKLFSIVKSHKKRDKYLTEFKTFLKLQKHYGRIRLIVEEDLKRDQILILPPVEQISIDTYAKHDSKEQARLLKEVNEEEKKAIETRYSQAVNVANQQKKQFLKNSHGQLMHNAAVAPFQTFLGRTNIGNVFGHNVSSFSLGISFGSGSGVSMSYQVPGRDPVNKFVPMNFGRANINSSTSHQVPRHDPVNKFASMRLNQVNRNSSLNFFNSFGKQEVQNKIETKTSSEEEQFQSIQDIREKTLDEMGGFWRYWLETKGKFFFEKPTIKSSSNLDGLNNLNREGLSFNLFSKQKAHPEKTLYNRFCSIKGSSTPITWQTGNSIQRFSPKKIPVGSSIFDVQKASKNMFFSQSKYLDARMPARKANTNQSNPNEPFVTQYGSESEINIARQKLLINESVKNPYFISGQDWKQSYDQQIEHSSAFFEQRPVKTWQNTVSNIFLTSIGFPSAYGNIIDTASENSFSFKDQVISSIAGLNKASATFAGGVIGTLDFCFDATVVFAYDLATSYVKYNIENNPAFIPFETTEETLLRQSKYLKPGQARQDVSISDFPSLVWDASKSICNKVWDSSKSSWQTGLNNYNQGNYFEGSRQISRLGTQWASILVPTAYGATRLNPAKSFIAASKNTNSFLDLFKTFKRSLKFKIEKIPVQQSLKVAAKDSGVPKIILALEKNKPGSVINSQVELHNFFGKSTLTDLDIVTNTHIFQVKRGGRQLKNQLKTTKNWADIYQPGKEVIGVIVKKSKKHALIECEKFGFKAFNDIEKLIFYINSSISNKNTVKNSMYMLGASSANIAVRDAFNKPNPN